MPKYDVTAWIPLTIIVESESANNVTSRDVNEAFMEQYDYSGRGYIDLQINYSGYLDWQVNWEIEDDLD
jgi:hypothetical protein